MPNEFDLRCPGGSISAQERPNAPEPEKDLECVVCGNYPDHCVCAKPDSYPLEDR